MHKVLIADSSEEVALAMGEALGAGYEIMTCTDSSQTLLLLGSWMPDILVLDLMLPGSDGLTMLQQASQSACAPKIVAVSRFFSDYVIDAAASFGVVYMARKPCAPENIAHRIDELARRMEPPLFHALSPQGQVTNMLLELSIPTKRNGFNYSRVAILLLNQNRNRLITKDLYPEVGNLCNASAIQVERSIRAAIEAGWKNRNEDAWRRYFPSYCNGHMTRPTNTEFLTRLADALEQVAVRIG